MLSETEIKQTAKQAGITREIIGYSYYVDLKRLVLHFKPFENPHEEPTMGGRMVY